LKTSPSSTRTWLPAGLCALFVLFIFLLWDISSHTHFGEMDFMGYWSATYLFHHGENPYSADLMTTVQRMEVHSTLDATIMSWNPPVLFVFLLPLVWMSFPTAKFVWLLINLSLVVTAGLMLTGIYMQTVSPRVKLTFLIFVIGFPAVIAGLYMGQVTFLVFWGLVACVTLIKREQWFWAGAILILAAIKPHMTILSGIYLLVYMAKHRQWRGWMGLALTGIGCLIILFLFRPTLIYDLRGETVVASVPWATSTLGGLLSYLGLSNAARYLIFLFLPLPLLLAKYSETIGVELSVALLTLITVPTTFFGWSYDQAILLIPIAQVFAWLIRSRYKVLIITCITCAMVLNYYQRLLIINDTYYVWVPLFWWVIFGVVWRSISLTDDDHDHSKIQSFSNHHYKPGI
jgi:hypothetical protein